MRRPATSNAKSDVDATEADNAKWSPDERVVFTSTVYPDCAAITSADQTTGDRCNKDRGTAAAKEGIEGWIFTHLLYRHWNHFTGDKSSHLFLVTLDSGAMRDLNPNDTHDVPPFSLAGGGGFDISPDSKELAFTENLDPEPAISTNADIFTLDLTDPSPRPVKISTSPGGDFNPAYSPDGKYLAWRSQARAGYESDKFRLVLYDRAGKTIRDLLPKFENWVDEFAWSGDSTAIYFASGEAGRAPLKRVRISDGEYWNMSVIGNNSGEFSDLHALEDSHEVLAVRMTIDQPGEVVRIGPSAANVEGGNSKGEFGPVS
jgi:dipeptidyl aminopeptidase/acylaminoacyl peptidase